LLVLYDLSSIGMAVAVYFNDERLFRTIEVYNVCSDAMLPTKFEPLKLSRSQLGPQPYLRAGHVGTKPTLEIEVVGLPRVVLGMVLYPS
jgi:hypothetical protein